MLGTRWAAKYLASGGQLRCALRTDCKGGPFQYLAVLNLLLQLPVKALDRGGHQLSTRQEDTKKIPALVQRAKSL